MKKAAIIYHFFAHYRAGVIKSLNASERWRYVWVGADIDSHDGIRATREWKLAQHVEAPFKAWGNVLWQWQVIRFAIVTDCDALVFLANPYYLSTWVATFICKLRRKRVLYWTHGWIAEDRFPKSWLRDWFLGRADALLLYGNRARAIGVRKGFDARRLHVINNSLDYDRQIIVRNSLMEMSPNDVRATFAREIGIDRNAALLVCTARLIPSCRFDLLIDAVESLRKRRTRPVNIVLIGDGPERQALERRAREKMVAVSFVGAVYDEVALGRMIYAADITVSPGKVGLTAIHSLMYGTPVITHNNFDRQFPEVEAVEVGSTGLLFSDGDAESLACAIERWLDAHPDKDRATVQACFRRIDEAFNPHVQRRLIENALEGGEPNAAEHA
jgi:1,2-diacylglycerol 3-alpha-glucosyltransferase